MLFKNKCNHTEYKLEADFADPVWCAKCSWNFDIEDLKISEELQKQLVFWVQEYIKIKNLKGSPEEIMSMKLNFNKWGEMLKVKLELELAKPILFVPMK
jgi:hypothetical protein